MILGLCSQEEERLVRDLFRGYNKLIRPVQNMTQKVEVAFGLAFIQLINVVSNSLRQNFIFGPTIPGRISAVYWTKSVNKQLNLVGMHHLFSTKMSSVICWVNQESLTTLRRTQIESRREGNLLLKLLTRARDYNGSSSWSYLHFKSLGGNVGSRGAALRHQKLSLLFAQC